MTLLSGPNMDQFYPDVSAELILHEVGFGSL